MKHITILIPTRNRIEKLKKTLASIPDLDYVDVVIACDSDLGTFHYVESLNNPKIQAMLVFACSDTEFSGSVECKNLCCRDIEGGLLYATDDIIFQEGAIQSAFECFNKYFPYDDGVVGFVQTGNAFHPTGVGLVGQRFLRQYSKKQLFFPGYFHFACQEIYDLCLKLGGKFIQDRGAIILHKHPCNFKEEMDQTHIDARIKRREDHDLIKERRAKGLIWGNN